MNHDPMLTRHDQIVAETVAAISAIIRDQPYYPDTNIGKRQQWVKDQILEKIERGDWKAHLPTVDEWQLVPRTLTDAMFEAARGVDNGPFRTYQEHWDIMLRAVQESDHK